jgi:hypothetical protein
MAHALHFSNRLLSLQSCPLTIPEYLYFVTVKIMRGTFVTVICPLKTAAQNLNKLRVMHTCRHNRCSNKIDSIFMREIYYRAAVGKGGQSKNYYNNQGKVVAKKTQSIKRHMIRFFAVNIMAPPQKKILAFYGNSENFISLSNRKFAFYGSDNYKARIWGLI